MSDAITNDEMTDLQRDIASLAQNGLILRVHASGVEKGYEDGLRAGRSTLSYSWFFLVVMFVFTIGSIFGLVLSTSFDYLNTPSEQVE